MKIRKLKCLRTPFRASARMRKNRRKTEIKGIPSDIADIWWAIKLLDKWDSNFNERYKMRK
jgi:hypothetical protein